MKNSVVLKEKRMSGKWVEKLPWRYEHCRLTGSLLFIAFIFYIIAFTLSLESLQNVNLKTLECTYSGKMGSGFQIVRVQFFHVLLFASYLFPQLKFNTRN